MVSCRSSFILLIELIEKRKVLIKVFRISLFHDGEIEIKTITFLLLIFSNMLWMMWMLINLNNNNINNNKNINYNNITINNNNNNNNNSSRNITNNINNNINYLPCAEVSVCCALFPSTGFLPRHPELVSESRSRTGTVRPLPVRRGTRSTCATRRAWSARSPRRSAVWRNWKTHSEKIRH